MIDTAPTGLQTALREATKAPHRALDHHPVLAALINGRLSVQQYGDALAALHGVTRQFEQGVWEFLTRQTVSARSELGNFTPSRRLPALESDLAALGRLPLACSINLPPLRWRGELVGLLYTLEGSQLGGQVICRQVAAILGDQVPLSFFRGLGDETPAQWNRFLGFADRYCPATERTAALTMANAAFAAIRQHLDQCHSEMLANQGISAQP